MIKSRKKTSNPTEIKTLKKRIPWKSQNNDLFPNNNVKKLDYLLKNPDLKETTSFSYQRHQKIVRDYMSAQTPYRGILLYHGLGSGKTCSSIAIAEGLKNRRHTIIISPASLESNYKEELSKCGHIYYIKENKWSFTNLKPKLKEFRDIEKLKDEAFVIDPSGINYKDMDKDNKKKLEDQIEILINHYYSFIHYDGLRTIKLEEYRNTNYFDGKTIIVDEVHNLISMMSGGTSQGIIWYDIFIKCKNPRIIFLSGTPVVNYIHEYALLFNILRGPMEVISYKYSGKIDNIDEKIKIIKNYKHIDFCKISSTKTQIYFTKPPLRYKIEENGDLVYGITPQTETEWQTDLKTFLKDKCNINILIDSKSIKIFYCFPVSKKDFDSVFIDKSNDKIIKEDLFSRRIVGLVSYYMPPRNENDFPIQNETNLVETPMSMTQYLHYEKVRFDEIESEAQKKFKKKTKTSSKSTLQKKDHEDSTYKIFSRSACNFTFPESILRPTEKTLEKTIEQLKIEAEESLQKYMEEAKDIDDDEKDKIISDMSPKYFLIQDLVSESQGTSLIYTVLRHMEGVSALTKILNVYGWTQTTIEKLGGEWRCNGCGPKSYILYTGTERDPIARFYSRALFNNQWDLLPKTIIGDLHSMDCKTNLRGESSKLFIITKTGAEGITLKNVRQVHIVESHWNFVRTKQVIGRAVRYESHKELPKDERIVDIYQYVTTFGEDVLKLKDSGRHSVSIKALIDKDDGKTSDENVYSLSKKKESLVLQVEDIIKKIAFDCLLHEKDDCSTLTDSNEYTFDPDFEEDLLNSNISKTKTVKKNYSRIVIDIEKNKIFKKFPSYLHGQTLDWDEEEGLLFKIDNLKIPIGNFDGIRFKKIKK